MDKYPKIFPVNAQLLADLILVSLVEKDAFEEKTVAVGKLIKDFADDFTGVSGDDLAEHAGRFGGEVDFGGVLHGIAAILGTVLFQ